MNASEWADTKQRLEKMLADHLNSRPAFRLFDSHGGYVDFWTDGISLGIHHGKDAHKWEEPTREHLLKLAEWLIGTLEKPRTHEA